MLVSRVFSLLTFGLVALSAVRLANAAEPIWVAGAEEELNGFYGFFAAFEADGHARLRISASSVARIWVNGKFAGYVPVRAADGYARVDEITLDPYLTQGRNALAIEVSSSRLNQFYLPDRPPFLEAEVTGGGRILAATGRDVRAMRIDARVRKVNRFSYQRGFAEFLRVTPHTDDWRIGGIPAPGLACVAVPRLKSLPRGVPMPTFAIDDSFRLVRTTLLRHDPARQVKRVGCVANAGSGTLKGFRPDELEVNVLEGIRVWDLVRTSVSTGLPVRLSAGTGAVFESSAETAGFPRLALTCLKPAIVWLTMDEFSATNGVPDPIRFGSCVNACGWQLLEPGEYALECFEPNGLGSAHVFVAEGEISLRSFDVRTYANPSVARAAFACSDKTLTRVYDAARRSLALNAVDGFTDCPGRERGIYFGDTTFTARGADVLLGDNAMERLQYENYALAENFPDLPDGMIPMCYPADVTLGEAHWIPNFGLWSVIQLEGYARRSGDRAMVLAYRRRAEGILEWFRKCRNDEGLLEKMPGWVFVEWSDAQRFVQDVSFVSNMIYVRFLDAMARLYGRGDCAVEAEALRAAIRAHSLRGEWFADNAVRTPDGRLQTTENTSELCQYAAFFSGVASRTSDAALWRRLVDDLGPLRKDGVHKTVFPSNLLFGYSLRFWLLDEAGLSARLLNEIAACYGPQAAVNGCLWEAMQTRGTCYSACHGFPSMAAQLIVRHALGVQNFDRVSKTVCVRVPDDGALTWAEGVVPVSSNEELRVSWKRVNGKPEVCLTLPSGWKSER